MIVPGTLEALGLVLARTSAMVLAAPLLGTGTTFSGFKVGLIAVLTLVTWLANRQPHGRGWRRRPRVQPAGGA